MRAICVCSDAKVSRKMTEEDALELSARDLAVPASTNVRSILNQLRRYEKESCRVVIFSTYQSIDVVSDALREYGRALDLCICDEAHRTTGVRFRDREEADFTKVHDGERIPAARRLYMTATPRLYRESAKMKAAENDDILCSMDDESIYGKEFHRLTFNEAVSQGLLCDYKVLVLTVSEEDIPKSLRQDIQERYASLPESERPKELHFDDATKIIGCINGLSKRLRGDGGITKVQDPAMMRRAVAFCQTINPTRSNPWCSSTQMAKSLPQICKAYRTDLPENERDNVVRIEAQHIDGAMNAAIRNEKLAWLKAENGDPLECRVLCNVRCLSEGVDVPALDAVIFLSPRNSEVEVVQSVGRVMRTFGKNTAWEKRYGYIIIPVIVPSDCSPEAALADNERFKVVWTILNALRSHDEQFNAHVNQIALNKKRSGQILVDGVPPTSGTYGMGQNEGETGGNVVCEGDGAGEAVTLDAKEVAQQLDLRFGTLRDGIYARLVEKVGDRLYWENWARSVGEIAKKFIERIARLARENTEARRHLEDFVAGLKRNINPGVDEKQAIEMLAQHLITRPVFDALFEEYQFVNNNAVSRSMQAVLDMLERKGVGMEADALAKFYDSVRVNVGKIDNLEGRQTIIKNLYEKFFKGAFPLTVEKLGIVYTPVECVDFIIHSVEDILKREFGTSLTEENVHILDPFVGTGTFITRLLQSGLIEKKDMLRKYKREIHCNEVVLLAYYVADVNIEAVYHDLMRPEHYETYDRICLTDTFQLNERGGNESFSQIFPENSERVMEQKRTPIRVIIGNPPYSVGQKSANDNAQNLSYPALDRRIAETYAAKTQATNKNSLYDSYIKAFRWASDRILACPDGGIVAFISNGAWIDGNAQEGMRRCLQDEFSSIYVFNLRGNQRTSGELSRREGGKIFGSGSRTPVAITFLVKNPQKKGKAEIHYYDIGDYLTRDQKLKMVKDFGSVANIDWTEIHPNEKQDWINQRDGLFDSMILLGDKDDPKNKMVFFVPYYSNGLKTQRDAWCYNSSFANLENNMRNSIGFYNYQIDNAKDIGSIDYDDTKFSWTRACLNDFEKRKKYNFDESVITISEYRPFFKQNLFFYRPLNEMMYQIPKLFPTPNHENIVICVSGVGVTKDFTCIISDAIPDLELIGKSQCFPLYYYDNNTEEKNIFDTGTDDAYIRKDGVTDWILKRVRSHYHGARNITKEHIFYYVYGLLHSREYRERFAADLKKSLPRIPIVERIEDFIAFFKAGRQLADLHLHYETVAPHPDVVVQSAAMDASDPYDFYRVDPKMRFRSKDDKSVILYNSRIRVENIPAKAYDYVVNGKSAVEWIVERYCVSVDKKSLIKNDANDWAREHKKPRYILDLLLSVINVSTQTVDIVNALPKLSFD